MRKKFTEDQQIKRQKKAEGRKKSTEGSFQEDAIIEKDKGLNELELLLSEAQN